MKYIKFIMLQIHILLLLLGTVSCQVTPTWIKSSYIYTETRTIINNIQVLAGTTFPITFNDNLSAPQVALAIPKFRMISNGGSIDYQVLINFPAGYSSYFDLKYILVSPTELWHLDVRYIAYQKVDMLGDYFRIAYFQQNNGNTLNQVSVNSPTYRSETHQETLATALTDLANEHKFGVFVTGMKGSSPDHYQVNLTVSVTELDKVDLLIEVNPDFVLNNLYVYVLIADITGLYTEARMFVETALTKSNYGNQYQFYTPSQGFFDGSYICGMASFSMRDNYEFNISSATQTQTNKIFVVNDLTFSTSIISKYDQISHFVIYGRQCDSPYDYFSKTDRLCYAQCPNRTYIVEAYSVCDPCHYSCETCVDGTSCETCQANRQVLTGASLCTCVDYFYEDNNVCEACHYSCQTCSDDQHVSCLTCQANMKRVTNFVNSLNQTCPCDTGFQDVGISRCDEICGDSIANEDPCDDGNQDSEDGCTSQCIVEEYFTCDNSVSPSYCYYDTLPQIQVVKIQKNPKSNQVQFYINIEPHVPAMITQLSTDNFQVNFTLAGMSLSTVDNYTVLKGTYYEDLQGITGRISLIPNNGVNRFSKFNGTNQTLELKATDEQKLLYYTPSDYKISGDLEQISIYVSCFILGTSLFFSIGEFKYLGNQLFFTVQFTFLSFLILPYFTPQTVQIGKTRYLMGYNQLFGQNTTVGLAQQRMQYMGYSIQYYYNFNIMLIPPIVALILYAIYRILLYFHEQKVKKEEDYDEEFEDTTCGFIFSFFQFDFFVYWVLLSMQQIFVGTVLQTESSDNPAIYIYVVLCLISIIVCCIALIARPNSMTAYRVKPYHKHYGNKTFLFILFSFVFMDALLLIAVLVSSFVFYALLVFPVIIILYVAIQRPFKSILNTIRVIILEVCLIVVLVLQIVALNTDEEIYINFPIGYIVCILIAWFVTLCIWIALIVMKVLNKHEQVEEDSIFSKTNESDQNENEQMDKKMRQISYTMFNQPKPGPQLPNLLEMRQMEPNSQYLKPFTPVSSTRKLKDDPYDADQIKSKIKKSRAQQSVAEDQREDSEVTRKKFKPTKSQIKSPVGSGGKKMKSNIYRDILDSNVSRYK